MVVCPACRFELPDGAAFCGACGFRIAVRPKYPSAAPTQSSATPSGAPLSTQKPARDISKKARRRPPTAEQAFSVDVDLGGPLAGSRQPGRIPAAATPATAAAPQSRPVTPQSQPVAAQPPSAAAAPQPAPAPARPAVAVPDQNLVSGVRPKRERKKSGLELFPGGSNRTKTVEFSAADIPGMATRSARHALTVEVTLASQHNFYQGLSENISEGGLFVSTHQVHPVGTRFDLTFSLPELNRNCTAVCEVRWTREFTDGMSDDHLPGMGLSFVDLAEEDTAAVEVFLKHREPIFFDD